MVKWTTSRPTTTFPHRGFQSASASRPHRPALTAGVPHNRWRPRGRRTPTDSPPNEARRVAPGAAVKRIDASYLILIGLFTALFTVLIT